MKAVTIGYLSRMWIVRMRFLEIPACPQKYPALGSQIWVIFELRYLEV